MQRTALSSLEVRALDTERREFSGLATTPKIDTLGDQLMAEGATFELPLILLHGHDHRLPIGHVVDAQVAASGIRVKARLAQAAEPPLRDRITLAWQEIKAGLVSLSVGFRPLAWEPLPGKSGGLRFKSWRWIELSLVSVPCNVDCKIEQARGAPQMSDWSMCSPAVQRIMERWELEQQAKEDAFWQERTAAREQRAASASPIDLEKHLARRLLHECGRDALHVTINRRPCK